MKRSHKLFAIVLTLCLLIGALAIGASAEVDESKSFLDASRYSSSIQNYVQYSYDDDSTTINASTSSGTGTYFSLTKAADESFIRLKTKSSDTQPGKNNYRYTFFTNESGKTVLANKYAYATADFDIASMGTASFFNGMGFTVYTVKPSAYPFYVYTVTDGTDWYISSSSTYKASGTNVKISSEVGEWTHITFVLDLAGGTSSSKTMYAYVNGAYLTSKAISVTGDTEFQRIGTDVPKALISSDTANFAIDNITSNLYLEGYSSGDAYGLDDLIKNGGQGNLARCEDVVYNEYYAYNLPGETQAIATIGETKYYTNASASKAIAEGGNITVTKDFCFLGGSANNFTVKAYNGASVSIDSGLEYNASVVETTEEYTVYSVSKASTYTVNIYDGESLIGNAEFKVGDPITPETFDIAPTAQGNFKAEIAWLFKSGDELLPLSEFEGAASGETVNIYANTATITWLDLEGVTIDETEWFIGSVANHSFDTLPELEVFNNGWYELSYFWNSVDADLTVTGDATYSPIVAPVEAFTGLMYNYEFGNTYKAVYYVPTPAEDIDVTVTKATYAANISLDRFAEGKTYYDDFADAKVSTANITELEVSETRTINGKTYYKFAGTYISAYTWYGVNAFEAYFTVEYEGETYELSTKVAISRFGTKSDTSKVACYADTVLDQYECGSEEVALIINWIRYVNESYSAQGSNALLPAMSNYVTNHADCECVRDLKETLVNDVSDYTYENLTGFGATYFVDFTGARLGLYVPKEYYDANAETFKAYATLYGINDEAKKFETLTYNFNPKVDSETEKMIETTIGGNVYYIFLVDRSHAIYNSNAVYTINIELDGEVVMSGTYSLAAYIYNTNKDLGLYNNVNGEWVLDESKPTSGAEALDYNLLRAAMAYSEFARAAYNYKVD